MLPLLTWNMCGNGSVKGDVCISEVILDRGRNCYHMLKVCALRLVQVMQNLDSTLGTVLGFFLTLGHLYLSR